MSNLSSTLHCYKCLLFYSVFLSCSLGFITGATINLDVGKRQNPESKMFEDMKVVASEEIPEISRKDLVEIIQKSQFFQDIFSEQPDPTTIQFGHVCENPNEWEQRFEQRDFKNNHFQGKMRWGNKNGDYGEHYWDLGHAG